MRWRLGLDIGTNSIGWSAVELDQGEQPKPIAIKDSGVRIFSDGRDPQDKQSNAAQRRLPRGQRRNRDRYLKRRKKLLNMLVRLGLMPEDNLERKKLENFNPWQLRIKGLDEKLKLHELGRAIFHLNQRRGFQSNRKTDADPNEKGKIKQASARAVLTMEKEGVRTIGELMVKENIYRARLHGSGTQAYYEFYPTREMIKHEFEALWEVQKKHYPDVLNDVACEALRDLILSQRPLKPQPVGKCSLDPSDPPEERATRALPSQQRFRIFQEFNNLRIRLPGEADICLTIEQRNTLIEKALKTGKVTFNAMRKALKLPENARFNLESLKRKHLDGDKTAAMLTSAIRWGKSWRELAFDQQEKIVVRLLNDENEEKLIDWLQKLHGLEKEAAEAVANATSGRNWPQGHGRLGSAATGKVLEWLSSDHAEAADPKTGEIYEAPFTYDQAVRLAGYDSHSGLDRGDAPALRELPYYGKILERHVAFGTGERDDHYEKRIGKITNPTVHVVLNQIQKLINALTKRFGPPDEIIVEMARDLPLSAKAKGKLENEQSDNKAANDKRREELERLGISDNYENRLRLRLWEELNPGNINDRRCPYTGYQISIERLFSAEVEIDHILPFSKTLDDSIGNKTLCMRYANRFKGDETPYMAFSKSPEDYDWKKIQNLSVNLPSNKSWRFSPDAMQRYENDEQNFLDRQLVDTRYAARLAKTYLEYTGANVWVTPGRLTSDLRHAWGLNSILLGHNRQESDEGEQVRKNRNDHRHHAIDAVVIAMTDRGLLQKVATAAGRLEDDENLSELKLLTDMELPWPSFRDDVENSVRNIIVSHKPDHGVEGQLHEDTAYGRVKDPLSGEERLVSRKPIESLTPKQIENIGDLKIRKDLLELTAGLEKNERREALEIYSSNTGVRRVRVHKKQADYEIIRHGDGHEKAVIPGENFCVDLVETPDGVWRGVGVTRFEANRQKRLEANGREYTPLWKRTYPEARHLMRVHKGDLLKLEDKGRAHISRVVQLEPSSSRFRLASHKEAGQLQVRHDDKTEDYFRWDLANFMKLKIRKARKIYIDPTGHIFDPGSHK